jgi:DNA-binding NarL/FixJ family response regulator
MLRCLLVDDSHRFRQAARGLLEREGIAVVGMAATGAEALRLAKEVRPDVALVDIDLGGQSGFDVVRLLHGEAGLDPAQLILISTHSGDDYADLISASPVAGFLAKTTLCAAGIRALLRLRNDGDTGGDR